MITKADITSIRFFSGCQAGLNDKTAVVEIAVQGVYAAPDLVAERWRTGAEHLCPAEPLWGMNAIGWPGAFLKASEAPSDSNSVTDFASWMVALTVALQRWAREPVWQGRVLSFSGGVLRLALPYQREAIFKAALQLGLQHLMLWAAYPLSSPEHAKLGRQLTAWLAAVQGGGTAPNTLRFFAAARQREMPAEVFLGVLRVGQGCQTELLDSSFTGRTSNMATRLAHSKTLTNQLLLSACIAVPPSATVASFEQALAVAQKMGWPVVVKPSNQEQGLGVRPSIRDEKTLKAAYEAASKYSPGAVIVEKHVQGDDHRMLVVGGRLSMVTKRLPGSVLGDGDSTVRALLMRLNADPLRGSDKRSLMMRIELDETALTCLTEQGMTPDSVPEAGQRVLLRRTANVGTGGTVQDVTHVVHPDNRLLAERAARTIGLDIAGVDFLCPDITRSWRDVGGAICEVNAQPGFRPHWLGDPTRDVNGEIVDWLFQGKSARIPTAAIAGTNGKSTTAQMLHHIWMHTGKTSGLSSSQGVWVGHDLATDANLSGCPGARMLLNDPAVEAAVMEMPRKGLLVFGHACDRYDVAALLNVQDDHIGVDGIASLQAMAELKAQVLQRATQAVVINADDPLCMAVRHRAGTQRYILVALEGDNPAVRAHLAQDGEAVFIQRHQASPWVVLAKGAVLTPLMPLYDIPATMNGLLRFNESNALFAAALAWAQGVELAVIRAALGSFANTAEQNPGRYNLIEGFPFQVLLDHGHNPDGVRELCEVVSRMPVKGQRHFLNQKLGNRHKAHFIELSPDLSKTFDYFVLSCDSDLVKKCLDYAGDDPVNVMFSIHAQALLSQGVATARIAQDSDKKLAMCKAFARAKPGDLVVLLADPLTALPWLEAQKLTFGTRALAA